jgi:hypothetical protein
VDEVEAEGFVLIDGHIDQLHLGEQADLKQFDILGIDEHGRVDEHIGLGNEDLAVVVLDLAEHPREVYEGKAASDLTESQHTVLQGVVALPVILLPLLVLQASHE